MKTFRPSTEKGSVLRRGLGAGTRTRTARHRKPSRYLRTAAFQHLIEAEKEKLLMWIDLILAFLALLPLLLTKPVRARNSPPIPE
jgi:type II secretory pathway component PulM